jgi:hypothetical protein
MAPPTHPHLTVAAQYQCGLVCLVAEDSELAAREVLRPGDLAGQRLITIEPPSAPQQQLLARLPVAIELRSGPIAAWIAQAGVGVALVDAATVVGQVYTDLVARPFRPDTRLDVCVLYDSRRPLSRTAQAFCRLFDAAWRRHFQMPGTAAKSPSRNPRPVPAPHSRQ